MRQVAATLLVLHSMSVGCHRSGTGEGGADEGCGYEEREVSLDAKFGEETPRAVIELLERPVAGPVTWAVGESEYVDVSGASGQTEFQAQASAGPTVWVREGIEGKGGVVEDRIFCPTELIFDVAVHFETTDGALAEDWSGRGVYGVSGMLGGTSSLAVTVEDPPPFSGSLTVTEHPGIPEQWETHELVIALNFATQPLDFVGMHGGIRYHLANLGDGEGELATVTIAEFALLQ